MSFKENVVRRKDYSPESTMPSSIKDAIKVTLKHRAVATTTQRNMKYQFLKIQSLKVYYKICFQAL